jgi:hypothetical protein
MTAEWAPAVRVQIPARVLEQGAHATDLAGPMAGANRETGMPLGRCFTLEDGVGMGGPCRSAGSGWSPHHQEDVARWRRQESLAACSGSDG